MSQGTFALLGTRRFAGFFVTQFLGAMNDNIFKNVLMIMIAYRFSSEATSGLLINLAAGLFILPFFLLSPMAGQLADKFEKAMLIRIVKASEIAFMLLGTVGFMVDSLPLLLVTLLLMGIHSTFFGPIKYSILPQHLAEDELVSGNALVSMGTFIAILLGTIIGGTLAENRTALVTGGTVVAVAVAGFFASRTIPPAPAAAPTLRIDWNPFTQMAAMTRLLRSQPGVTSAVMGISWFWYVGSTVLAQLPNFTRHALYGNEQVVILLLTNFAIAISIGAAICAKVSRGKIETGLVLVGAVGMSVFTADLFFMHKAAALAPSDALGSAWGLATGPSAMAFMRAVTDLFLTGISSAFFIVPLYALMQHRSDPSLRSRIVAINNVYNSVFMVGSALLAMTVFKAGLTTVDLLLITAGLNLVFAAVLAWRNSEYPRRTLALLTRGQHGDEPA
ncbi:MAG: MFS transporter [Deltaproteobacteria bacterium]|nr:MFS transporter [Deltaproteobacteria bacterium]